MRARDPSAPIDELQARIAESGAKGMIPVGRPFLDYILSGLADAGITDACLVIGPEHRPVRERYGRDIEVTRLRVHFAVQDEPLGTANAIAAAESFADGEHVVALNSDNYYPVHALAAIRELGTAGVAAFERGALLRLGNIDADRVAQFAIILADGDGMLERIVEKPAAGAHPHGADDVLVGMNLWSLPPEIYDACRRIPPSPRGELELPDAVQYARDRLHVPFRVLVFREGVLDLSSRSDIPAVADRLRDITPRL